MANVKIRPRYQTIEGITIPLFPPHCFREALNYKPTPDDIFIVTYPKSGTTWMQNIVLYIFGKGQEIENLKEDFHRLSPFIDRQGINGIEQMPRPGAFKTHLPYTHVPYSPDAKYIYAVRNPKDCCVSLYYHTKRVGAEHYDKATFDDFFEVFMTGEVEYNDYFDHLASWYPHRNDKQVFFTTFEDMKEDLKPVVLRLASFLGKEYAEVIEKDNNILNNILHLSSFEYMKRTLSQTFSKRPKAKGEGCPGAVDAENLKKKSEKPEFIRKGIVGDWINHFSEEQSQRLNEKFIERTQGTEVFDKYKICMGL